MAQEMNNIVNALVYVVDICQNIVENGEISIHLLHFFGNI